MRQGEVRERFVVYVTYINRDFAKPARSQLLTCEFGDELQKKC